MALTFPTTDIDSRMALPFPAKFYVAAASVNGADAGSPIFLGGTEAGGASVHFSKSSHHVMVEQYLNEVASFPIKEEFLIKGTFNELNLAKLFQILQTADATMALVGGTATDTSSSLTFGEQPTAKYWQLIVRGYAPPGATNGQRLIQAYRCVIHQLGEIKLEKAKESALAVTWKCLTDTGAKGAGKAAVLQFLDS